jgi:hypothetical protein
VVLFGDHAWNACGNWFPKERVLNHGSIAHGSVVRNNYHREQARDDFLVTVDRASAFLSGAKPIPFVDSEKSEFLHIGNDPNRRKQLQPEKGAREEEVRKLARDVDECARKKEARAREEEDAALDGELLRLENEMKAKECAREEKEERARKEEGRAMPRKAWEEEEERARKEVERAREVALRKAREGIFDEVEQRKEFVRIFDEDTARKKVRGPAPKKRKKIQCSDPGCINIAVSAGVCYSHGAQRKKRKKCSDPGCINIAKSAGVCYAHGAPRSRKSVTNARYEWVDGIEGKGKEDADAHVTTTTTMESKSKKEDKG